MFNGQSESTRQITNTWVQKYIESNSRVVKIGFLLGRLLIWPSLIDTEYDVIIHLDLTENNDDLNSGVIKIVCKQIG